MNALTFTLAEAQALVASFGGDAESTMTVARSVDQSELRAWSTDYPDDGSYSLSAVEVDGPGALGGSTPLPDGMVRESDFPPLPRNQFTGCPGDSDVIWTTDDMRNYVRADRVRRGGVSEALTRLIDRAQAAGDDLPLPDHVVRVSDPDDVDRRPDVEYWTRESVLAVIHADRASRTAHVDVVSTTAGAAGGILRRLVEALDRANRKSEAWIAPSVVPLLSDARDFLDRAQSAKADAAKRSARPAPFGFLASHRRDVVRAIEAAENPKGMSIQDGMARVHASILRRMLTIIDGAVLFASKTSDVDTARLGELIDEYREAVEHDFPRTKKDARAPSARAALLIAYGVSAPQAQGPVSS